MAQRIKTDNKKLISKNKWCHHHCPTYTDVYPDAMKLFDKIVELAFEDGSKVTFRYAFAKKVDKYLEVYTEHCGYHAFYIPSLDGIHIYHM